jgi:hypothetical protein
VVDDIVVSCYDYAIQQDQSGTSAQNPHEKLDTYRVLYSLGNTVYKGLHETKFAIDVLENLIKVAGLEKLYATA